MKQILLLLLSCFVQLSFAQATPNVHPLLLANDWFHGVTINFDYLLFDFIPAEEGSNSNAYAYVNSYLGLLYLTCSSLRAPPMMKRISFQHLFMV